MLMRTDPFRDSDRLTRVGTRHAVASRGDADDGLPGNGHFVVHLDLPGASADSIDLTVEQNVLTIHAERKAPDAEGVERVVDERKLRAFSRQLFLGDTLDSDRLSASYDAGVLTLSIPIAEKGSRARSRSPRVNRAGRSTPPDPPGVRSRFPEQVRGGKPTRREPEAAPRLPATAITPDLGGSSATAP